MCRLTLYKGRHLLIGDVIVWPDNSLLCQSRDAHYHPGIVDDEKNRRNQVVNGDGFGVAFYSSERPDNGACCFKFVTPAWSDINLKNIGAHISSGLIMAHIRAAAGDPFEDAVVSLENCHPFKYKRWCFMHNGAIPNFKRIKMSLLNLLPYEVFRGLTGSTDSEHIFALFLSFLPTRSELVSMDVFIAAVEKTLSTILHLSAAANCAQPCSLNFVISDGMNVIATRFRSGKEAPPSLYYNYGSDFVCSKDGHFFATNQSKPREIVISSAPLSRENTVGTGECEETVVGQWILMPRDHMLVVVGDPKVRDICVVSDVYLRPLEIADYDFERHSVNVQIDTNDDEIISSSEQDSPESFRLGAIRGHLSISSLVQRAKVVATELGVCCNRVRTVGARDRFPRGSLNPSEQSGYILMSESNPRQLTLLLGTPLLLFVFGTLVASKKE